METLKKTIHCIQRKEDQKKNARTTTPTAVLTTWQKISGLYHNINSRIVYGLAGRYRERKRMDDDFLLLLPSAIPQKMQNSFPHRFLDEREREREKKQLGIF